jgi:hypothetical protein
MSKVFLTTNETMPVNGTTTVYGGTGTETVILASGVKATLDGNIEKVVLSGSVSDYTFRVSGTQISVLSSARGETVDFIGINGPVSLDFSDYTGLGLSLTGIGRASAGSLALTGNFQSAQVQPSPDSRGQSVSQTDTGVQEIENHHYRFFYNIGMFDYHSNNQQYDYLKSLPDKTVVEYRFVNDTSVALPYGLDSRSAWTAGGKSAVTGAFDQIETFLPLTFVENNALALLANPDHATTESGIFLETGQTTGNKAGYWTTNTGIGSAAGNLLVDQDIVSGLSGWVNPAVAGFIGYAMGLVPPHGSDTWSAGHEEIPEYADENTGLYSVMAQRSTMMFSLNNDGSLKKAFTGQYTVADMMGMQYIHGIKTENKDNTWVFSDYAFPQAIHDGGGTDTIDGRTCTQDLTIDLRSQENILSNSPDGQVYVDVPILATVSHAFDMDAFARTLVRNWQPGISASALNTKATALAAEMSGLEAAYAPPNYQGPSFFHGNKTGITATSIIENAKGGSGNDTLYDNPYDNRFEGGAGNDTFHFGAGGYDRIDGGTGQDTLVLDMTQAETEVKNQDGYTWIMAVSTVIRLTGVETIQFEDAVLSI